MERVEASPTSVTYDPATGQVRVAEDERGDEESTTHLLGSVATTFDGERAVPEGEATVERETVPGGEKGDDRRRVRVTHDDDHETTVVLRERPGAVDLTVRATNAGDAPVRFDALTPLGAATARGATTEDGRYEFGYQSWTPTGRLPYGERFPREDPRDVPMMTDTAAPNGPTSHAMTVAETGAGAVTMGFLDHERYLSRFDYRVRDEDGAATDEDPVTVTAICPGDGVELAPGETVESATLRVAVGERTDALENLAATVGERMDARVPEAAPTGWCSWYHYFTDVTEADVRENLRELDEWGIPVDVVQLDDGYQTAFGDWRTLADGFEDVAGLVDDIEAAGHTPGLWCAPFFVQASSDLALDHPDWFVTRGGHPVDAGQRHGDMYGLDVTHPEVEAWLRDTFTTFVDEWGFDYLKLDFLYAAALPGDRYEDVTRVEAYRHGLEVVREAVGDDTFVLGCGAPQAPSVGLVDAMRVGPDTAPHWSTDGAASQPAHENAVRNVLNRDFLHRRWWVDDPDCHLLRATTDLTEAERRTFAALVALTGGANVVSDRVAEIDEAGRRLFERTLPTVEGGTVAGLARERIPAAVVHHAEREGAAAVAAFNWADEERETGVPTVGSGPVLAWDVFAERLVEAGSGPEAIARSVPAHGSLLAHVAPARDRPTVVGTGHLANGGDRLAVDWEADAARLAVTLADDRPATLVVAVPEGYRLADCDVDVLDDDSADAPEGWTVRRVSVDSGESHCTFDRV